MNSSDGSTEKKKFPVKLIFAGVILILALLFVFSNTGEATLHFFGFRFIAPGWIWFLAVLAVGVVIGSIFPWFRKKKK